MNSSPSPKNSRAVTLIKWGGSVITDKTKPSVLNQVDLDRLASELARARQKNSQHHYILGHGQGGFAHVPASKYGTAHGYKDDSSPYGLAEVYLLGSQLHLAVIQTLVKQGIAALSWRIVNTVVLDDGLVSGQFFGALPTMLNNGIMPVTGGDVLLDTKHGCSIWSTEKVLASMARELAKHEYLINAIVHVTDVPGVLDAEGKTIPLITAENWPEVAKSIGQPKGVDVTGGMKHKIEVALDQAKQGVTSYIVSGLQPENLYRVLTNGEWIGTKVQ